MSSRDPATPIRPNLLVIGAMKASTTLFCQLLGEHPAIWFPVEKEPHYFTSPRYGTAEAWAAYLKHFRACPPGRTIIGDGSTGYSKIPEYGPTPQRVRETLGQPKLIYILRDPVDRSISNYKHSYALGMYPPGMALEEAVDYDPLIITASRYMRQLRAYTDEFGAAAVHLILAEELHDDHPRVLAGTCAYLGIDSRPGWRADLPRVNSAADVRSGASAARLLGSLKRANRLAKLLPVPARRMAKWAVGAVGPRPLDPPPITPAARRRVIELIADDLCDLRDRLGPRLDRWPSVQALGRDLQAPTA